MRTVIGKLATQLRLILAAIDRGDLDATPGDTLRLRGAVAALDALTTS